MPDRTTHPTRIALAGLGNVGRAFLDLMGDKADMLRDRYGLELVLTGAGDSSGAVLDPHGLNPAELRAHKAAGRGAGSFPGGLAGMTITQMAAAVEADILLEASAVNLATGQPGLDCVRTALRRGIGVVLANKGPLVHAFAELTAGAQAGGVGMKYSATVCGALPVVNIGRRDLAGCEIRSVRGIFNSTSNSILAAMTRGGDYAEALRQAQIDGIAEADPRLDVEGWDTANKLVIIANSVLGQPATLADVQPVTGITGITPDQIRAGAMRGQVVKLVATAVAIPDAACHSERVREKKYAAANVQRRVSSRAGDSSLDSDRHESIGADPLRMTDARASAGYRLSVQPQWLPSDDFLANVSGWEMGIVFDTDIMGLQQLKVDERGPVPTAGAMLRDVIALSGK